MDTSTSEKDQILLLVGLSQFYVYLSIISLLNHRKMSPSGSCTRVTPKINPSVIAFRAVSSIVTFGTISGLTI
jgi:hypothetical protein